MLLEVGIFLWILGKSGMLGSADGFHGEWGLEGILEGMGKEGMRMGGRKWEKGMGEGKKEMGKGNGIGSGESGRGKGGNGTEGNGKREWDLEWKEWERKDWEWREWDWEWERIPAQLFWEKGIPRDAPKGPVSPTNHPRDWGRQLRGNSGSHGQAALIPAGSSFGMLRVRSSPEGLLGFRDRSGAMGAAADAEWLRWVSKQFGNAAGKEKEISLEEFKSALQVKEVRDPWEK